MKQLTYLGLLALLLPSTVLASLAGSVGLFVYPSNNQTAEQIEQDDYQCYAWAKDQTGFDPINAKPPEEVAASNPGADGSAMRGALRGAARGAIIGEIADDDASKGAEIGAAMGAMRGRSHSRHQSSQQAANQNAQNQSQYDSRQNDFKKAMSLCLEARGYAAQ